MFFNVRNKNNIDEDDVVDHVRMMADRIRELEQENEMLREIIRDYKLGVA